MRIAYLTFHINSPAGGVRVIFEQANRLSERGHEVEIWTTHETALPLPFHLSEKVKVIKKELDFDGTPKIKDEHPPDIVILTHFFFVFATSYLDAKKVLLLQHDDGLVFKSLGLTLVEEYGFKKALSYVPVVSTSGWIQERLKSDYGKDSTVVPVGVDTSFFRKQNPLISKSGPVVFMLYDEFQPWKGTHEGIEAIKIVRKSFPEIRAIFLTMDVPHLYFIDFENQFFIRPPQVQLPGLYASADVCISPSWYEGFGLVGLEALACGVPLVTTDSGGVREYAIHEETALVVPPKNLQAIAEAVIRLLNDDILGKKFITNGLVKAREFDWDKSIVIMEKYLRNL